MGLFDSFKKRKQETASLEAMEQGSTLARLGRYEEAIASYKQAATFAPQNVYAYHRLGEVYTTLGLYEEALTSYKESSARRDGLALSIFSAQ